MQGRMIFFNQNNVENFIVGGATWFGNPNHILYPPLWFNKPAQNWNLVKELSSVDVSDIRNWRFFSYRLSLSLAKKVLRFVNFLLCILKNCCGISVMIIFIFR
jgi:hypothetical protein